MVMSKNSIPDARPLGEYSGGIHAELLSSAANSSTFSARPSEMVTTTIGADAETIARLEASGGPVADVLAGLLGFYRKSQQRLYGRDIAPFHDVCAVLPFVAPDLIEYRECHVAVELDGTHTRGMTVTDFRNIPDIRLSHFQHSLPANARVAVSVDAKTAVPHILDTVLAHYDGRRFAAEKVMDLSLET